jgi:excinuclease ABC subunit A
MKTRSIWRDYVVEAVGPGGEHGGQIITAGTPADIKKSSQSLTGHIQLEKKQIAVPEKRFKFDPNKRLTIKALLVTTT